jgi:hypothetical protein
LDLSAAPVLRTFSTCTIGYHTVPWLLLPNVPFHLSLKLEHLSLFGTSSGFMFMPYLDNTSGVA